MKNGDTLPDGATVSVIIITEILAIGRTYTGETGTTSCMPPMIKKGTLSMPAFIATGI